MKEQISHKGKVEKLTAGSVFVRIVQSSACSGCKIASHCSSAENKEKIIEVKNCDKQSFTIGQEVNIIASQNVGNIAVFYGFVLPFLIMMMVITGAYNLGYSEAIIGISGLCSLIPYYICLFLARGYFTKRISFTIE